MYLKLAGWSYQTCSEEAMYKPSKSDMDFFKEPSFDSEVWFKALYLPHEDWKRMVANDCNENKWDVDRKYGFMYNYPGVGVGVHTSNKMTCYDEKLDHKNKITWINVSETDQVWAPIQQYERPLPKCSVCRQEGHNKRTCKSR